MIARKAAATLLGLQIVAGAAFVSPAPLTPSARAIEEDDPSGGWSCVDDGNRVCGPGNPEGKPAACYDDGGVIAAYWPCVPVDPDEQVYQRGYTN